MPSMPKIASTWFPPQKTGFAIGVAISGFAAGDIIGLSATPYLLTWLNGWRNVFFVYGFWALILMCLWWVLAKENQDVHSVPKANPNSSVTKNFKALLGVKQVWLLTGLYLCASVCYDTFLLWLPSILDSEGVQLNTAGLIASMLPLGFIFASFVIGSLSDRAGLKAFHIGLGACQWSSRLCGGNASRPSCLVFRLCPRTLLYRCFDLSHHDTC